jgi:hypothetical protein
MPDATVPHGRTARPAPAIREIEVLWMTAVRGGGNKLYLLYLLHARGGPIRGTGRGGGDAREAGSGRAAGSIPIGIKLSGPEPRRGGLR